MTSHRLESAGLEVDACLSGDQTLLVLRGDLDLASAPWLRRHLDPVVERGGDVVIDLGLLDFVDCAGLRVLVDAVKRIKARGGHLQVRLARPTFRSVIAILGLTGVLEIGDDQC